MFEFIVCDDNNVICNTISKIIKDFSDKNDITSSITIFNDYDSNFINLIKNNKKQLIYILDIEMPSESGINIAKLIRKVDKESVIIFLTLHNDLAYNIIRERLNVLTFISKFVDYKKEIYESIKQAVQYVNRNTYIRFNDFKTSYCINTNSILYLTKDDRKTLIVTDSKVYDVYLSLTKIKELLPPIFMQSHRACIVNTERIEKIDYTKKIIFFDNDTETDLVSDKYKKELVIL